VNDFTREELEAILICIEGGIRHNINSDSLRNKIQAAIDNYPPMSGTSYLEICTGCAELQEVIPEVMTRLGSIEMFLVIGKDLVSLKKHERAFPHIISALETTKEARNLFSYSDEGVQE